jgi:exopolysaccharide biosynthesis polyprenyl glycosylphosphotransferase
LSTNSGIPPGQATQTASRPVHDRVVPDPRPAPVREPFLRLAPTPQDPDAGRSGSLEGRGWQRSLVVADSIGAVFAILLALTITPPSHATLAGDFWLFALVPMVVAVQALRGQYRVRFAADAMDAFASVVFSVSLVAMALATASMGLSDDLQLSALVVRVWVAAVVVMSLGRAALLALRTHRRRTRGDGERALIVGSGPVGVGLARRLLAHPESGVVPIGFLDVAEPATGAPAAVPLLGRPGEVASIATAAGAGRVIFAFSLARDEEFLKLVNDCREAGIRVSVLPRLFESMTARTEIDRLDCFPVLDLDHVDPRGWQFAVKHALDRIVAAAGLLVLALPMLAIVAAIKLSSPGPALFRQRRIGRDGQEFELLKFRTMRDQTADESFIPETGLAPGGVEGSDRRTTVGRLLRRTSLDELPQLINVLRGEMSVVGPRPERPHFVELFEHDVHRYADRHRVKSGITGLAQVKGLRGQTSVLRRVEWDNDYVANWSLWLDLKIAVWTLRAVARGE